MPKGPGSGARRRGRQAWLHYTPASRAAAAFLMFTPDVQVLDFTAQDWLRLPDLFRLSRAPWPAPAPANGGILAVREGQRLLKVTSTVSGRLPLPESGHAT